ncbi:hypothetical protein TNCV_416441 [Trichonephila clavipes]|nr:hypothetical protein TNCV_416441 [Trichonephila clavipes]
MYEWLGQLIPLVLSQQLFFQTLDGSQKGLQVAAIFPELLRYALRAAIQRDAFPDHYAFTIVMILFLDTGGQVAGPRFCPNILTVLPCTLLQMYL